VHSWFNDQARALDASLYGRRMYELMADYWPTGDSDPAATDAMRDFARIWRPMPKIVFSTSLDRVDPTLASCRAMWVPPGRASPWVAGDIDVGGPNLAGQFVRRGLVDEYRLVVHPVELGAETPVWPDLDAPLPLRLVETRSFASGAELRSYGAHRDRDQP
jgi:dihydrofolate reductase